MRIFGRFLSLFFFAQTPLVAGLYNPKTFTLPNGLQVVVIENHRAPVVTQMVWYRVGSGDDPWGKSGLAHYLEHMMFKGPKGSASAVLSREVEDLGGTNNAATSYNFTYYYETVASQYLENIMRLESARMKELRLVESEAVNELQVILEERRMRTDNSPIGRFIEFFHSQFFRNNPRRLPPIGWEHEIRGLTSSDVKAFHEKWYAPGNAILFLAGDVTFEEAKRLAKKYYGPLKARPVAKRNRLKEPPQPQGTARFDLTMPDVKVPYLIKAFPAPSIFSEKGKYAYSSDVLNHFLGKVPTGFVHKELVEKKKVATFAQIYYPGGALEESYLLILCQPTPGTPLETLEKELSETLKSFKDKAISKESLGKVKAQMLAKLVYSQDSALSGREIAEGLILGRNLEDLDNWDKRISDVTVEEVKELYDVIFSSPYKIISTLLPQPEKKPSEERLSTLSEKENPLDQKQDAENKEKKT